MTGSRQPPNQPYLAQLEMVVVIVDVVSGLVAEEEVDDDDVVVVVLSSCEKICKQEGLSIIRILGWTYQTSPPSRRFAGFGPCQTACGSTGGGAPRRSTRNLTAVAFKVFPVEAVHAGIILRAIRLTSR